MTTAMTGNVDIAVRTQVDYYGAGRYDLAGQMVTEDYVDHEAPPGTPPGRRGPTRSCAGCAARSPTCPTRSATPWVTGTASRSA